MEVLVILIIILTIISWISLATIASIIGNSKGEDAGVWFFYGLFLPPIAIAHAIVRHRTLTEERKRHTLAGRVACHLCDEYISPNAVVCPFCQRNIERDEAPAAQPASTSEISDDTQSVPTTEQPTAETNGDSGDTIFLYGLIGVGIVVIVILSLVFTSN